jgi:CRISPR-associated exonuclease Cas4
LRDLTEDVIDRTHKLIDEEQTPPARYDKKCDACSLYERCLPKTCGQQRNVAAYLKRMLGEEL